MFAKLSVIALASALTCTAASAEPVGAAHADTVLVRTTAPLGDLDLTTGQGARAALNRINAAATQVCGAKPAPSQLAAHAHYRACKKEAVDRAVAGMDNPLVTALHSTPQPARLAAQD